MKSIKSGLMALMTPLLMGGGCDIVIDDGRYRDPHYDHYDPYVEVCLDEWVAQGYTPHGYAILEHLEDGWDCTDYLTLNGETEMVDEGCNGTVDWLSWNYWDPGCSRYSNYYNLSCSWDELWDADVILDDVKWSLNYDKCW